MQGPVSVLRSAASSMKILVIAGGSARELTRQRALRAALGGSRRHRLDAFDCFPGHEEVTSVLLSHLFVNTNCPAGS